MSRQQRLRHLGTGLLYALMAMGAVFVGVGAALPHPRLLASGI